MKNFLIALQFLTIFPVKISAPKGRDLAFGGKSEIKAEDFGKSLLYFPLIGTIIGVILALSLYVFSLILPPIITGLLVLIVLVVITGGIHLDGFGDTCDGFCGSRLKHKTLEIMRDSHIGVIGAIGLILILLLKFSLFYSIPVSILGKTLIIMATQGRWVQVLACYSANYVQHEGKGKPFVGQVKKSALLFSALFSLAVAILVMGRKGAVLFIGSIIVILPVINYIKKRIGGMTGDTVGAVSEVSEIIILLISLILI